MPSGKVLQNLPILRLENDVNTFTFSDRGAPVSSVYVPWINSLGPFVKEHHFHMVLVGQSLKKTCCFFG